MKEVNIPTEYRDEISKYDNETAENILWYAFLDILKSNGEPVRGRVPLGQNQEIIKKQIAEMKTDGLIENVRTKRLHIIPKERLRPTEKGRYVLYGALSESYEKALDEWGSRGKAKDYCEALSNLQDENSFLIQKSKAEAVAKTLNS